WSFEGYTMFTTVQLPAASGASVLQTTLGSGTHADYRISDHLAASVDASYAALGGPQMTATELGARFRPLPAAAQVTPFFDLRAGYSRISDNYSIPLGTTGIGGGPQSADGQPY